MAAYTAGVKTVFIPHDNLRDLEEIDPLARESMTFVPCKHVEEILSRALVESKTIKREESACAASVFIPTTQSVGSTVHASEHHE